MAVSEQEIRCVSALTKLGSSLSAALKEAVISGYNLDPFCLALINVLPLRKECQLIDKLLYIDGRLVVPADRQTRRKLIKEAHHCLGHLGYTKMVAKLRHNFFWPKMAKEVELFVKT